MCIRDRGGGVEMWREIAGDGRGMGRCSSKRGAAMQSAFLARSLTYGYALRSARETAQNDRFAARGSRAYIEGARGCF
eukprot:3390416-Pleurochrysis_carterae.AAC.1